MNQERTTRKLSLLAVGFALSICLAASPLLADDASSSDDWRFEAEIYAWGAHMKGEAFTGDDFKVPLENILSNLDFMFMGSVVARKNEWAMFADLVYLDIGAEEETAIRPRSASDGPISVRANLDMKSYISTFGGAYQVSASDRSSFHILAGARYLNMDMELAIQRTGQPVRDTNQSSTYWDVVAGGSGMFDLGEKWYVNYYADIGTGDSDLTWQLKAGINYRLKKTSLSMGYRILKWEFDSSEALQDLSTAGPYFGVRIPF